MKKAKGANEQPIHDEWDYYPSEVLGAEKVKPLTDEEQLAEYDSIMKEALERYKKDKNAARKEDHMARYNAAKEDKAELLAKMGQCKAAPVAK